jgi:hypothetical protein
MLRNRVRLLEGERDEAVAALRALVEGPRPAATDLAAEIWGLVAESVTK